MKKLLSISLLIIIFICFAFVFTGCTNKGNDLPLEEQVNIPTNDPNVDNTNDKVENNTQNENVNTQLKAEKALAPLTTKNYYIKLLTDAENDVGEIVKNATVEITIDGNNFATDMKDIGYGMIVKDETMYSIMHSIKQYVAMDLDPNAKQEMLKNFTDENFINTFIKLGTKDFNGNNYYFEEYKFENETNILYFENDNLKYIETIPVGNTQSTIIQIIEISNKTKKELFDIPNDYTSFQM